MPYVAGNFDSPHIYVQWGGKLPGGDQWSCGLRMRKKTSGTPDNGAALLAGVAGAIATHHVNPSAAIAGAAKLSFVKVNALSANGHYTSIAGTNQAVYADLAGGAGTNIYPNQICLVVSLLTGFSRGPAHRGRFFQPLPALAVGSDGRADAVACTNVSNAVDTLINGINAVDADYEVAVFSRKSGAAGNRRVTSNEVGRTLDTQRRRRSAVVEDYR